MFDVDKTENYLNVILREKATRSNVFFQHDADARLESLLHFFTPSLVP